MTSSVVTKERFFIQYRIEVLLLLTHLTVFLTQFLITFPTLTALQVILVHLTEWSSLLIVTDRRSHAHVQKRHAVFNTWTLCHVVRPKVWLVHWVTPQLDLAHTRSLLNLQLLVLSLVLLQVSFVLWYCLLQLFNLHDKRLFLHICFSFFFFQLIKVFLLQFLSQSQFFFFLKKLAFKRFFFFLVKQEGAVGLRFWWVLKWIKLLCQSLFALLELV